MKDCLILADDLSGAADCAVSALRRDKQEVHRTISDLVGEGCTTILCDGAQKLQLLDELEPGVFLAFVSAPRPLLVVVKAGGFGDPDTLQNAYRFLKKIWISHE